MPERNAVNVISPNNLHVVKKQSSLYHSNASFKLIYRHKAVITLFESTNEDLFPKQFLRAIVRSETTTAIILMMH